MLLTVHTQRPTPSRCQCAFFLLSHVPRPTHLRITPRSQRQPAVTTYHISLLHILMSTVDGTYPNAHLRSHLKVLVCQIALQHQQPEYREEYMPGGINKSLRTCMASGACTSEVLALNRTELAAKKCQQRAGTRESRHLATCGHVAKVCFHPTSTVPVGARLLATRVVHEHRQGC